MPTNTTSPSRSSRAATAAIISSGVYAGLEAVVDSARESLFRLEPCHQVRLVLHVAGAGGACGGRGSVGRRGGRAIPYVRGRRPGVGGGGRGGVGRQCVSAAARGPPPPPPPKPGRPPRRGSPPRPRARHSRASLPRRA